MTTHRPAGALCKSAQRPAHHRILVALLIGLPLVTAPAFSETTAEATKRIEDAPVNCATAQGDLRVLAAERDHAEKHKLQGVMAISPAGILLGAVTGTQEKHFEMLTGDYIKHIDQKVAEIKATCGL